MRRPSFQFYPDDWSANSNLKRCSHEEKGIWIDVMCVLHDQDEYGIVRWPLSELAQAVGTTKAKLKRLVEKGVLKGADDARALQPLVYVPRSGRRDGDPVTLIDAQPGALWYSSRMVLDEHKRRVRGGLDAAPKDSPDPSPKGGIGEGIDDTPNQAPKDSPDPSPKGGIGEGIDDTPNQAPKDSPDPSPLTRARGQASRAGASSPSSSPSSVLKDNPPNPPVGGEGPVSEKPKRERKPRIQLKTFIDQCQAAGEKPISEYRPLQEYVDTTGLPWDYVQLAWDVFKREFLPPGDKSARLQADWRRHFMNYVQKGYYRLWFAKQTHDGPVFELSTAGVQAQAFLQKENA